MFKSLGLLCCFVAASAWAQAPFLSYDFNSGGLDDFFNPNGQQAIDLCGQVIPAGEATIDSKELLLTNDLLLGLSTISLRPDTVAAKFPPSRNYRARVKVNLESVNELVMYLRGRIQIDEGNNQVHSILERGYVVGVFPQGVDAELTDGVLAVGEYTACHELVAHPEWPGGSTVGFARIGTDFPVAPGDDYWLEAAAQGDDDGGPVLVTAKLWPDGDLEPASPQIVVTDTDGLPHTPETLDPASEIQLSFGTSFDLKQQPGATARLDDLTLTELKGCLTPPLKATRTLWDPKVSLEGRDAALYRNGEHHDVRIVLTEIRKAGACLSDVVRITERIPDGWVVANVTDVGQIAETVVTWILPLATLSEGKELVYTVVANGSGLVRFRGDVRDDGSDLIFPIEGDSLAVDDVAAPGVSDFGSIQQWLILGPFDREVGGANPGDDQIARDYLTDGVITEADVLPKAGDTIEPDYGGAAASTGLEPNALGRNPGGIPTWVEWRDLDDADDRIDFESVYGDLSNVMCYAVTYLDCSDDVEVNFGVSSDDSVQILLDGGELHRNNVARGALDRSYQDTPATHPGLGNVPLGCGRHVLLVKVFEGGGEHNFRVGFLDESGVEIPGGPPEITVSLAPPGVGAPIFRRGDADASGKLEITDAIFTLAFLFTGGKAPTCPDAADADDNGEIQITDPIRVLGYLFLGGGAPAAPGPETCGADPTPEDALGPCIYEAAACGGCR